MYIISRVNYDKKCCSIDRIYAGRADCVFISSHHSHLCCCPTSLRLQYSFSTHVRYMYIYMVFFSATRRYYRGIEQARNCAPLSLLGRENENATNIRGHSSRARTPRPRAQYIGCSKPRGSIRICVCTIKKHACPVLHFDGIQCELIGNQFPVVHVSGYVRRKTLPLRRALIPYFNKFAY